MVWSVSLNFVNLSFGLQEAEAGIFIGQVVPVSQGGSTFLGGGILIIYYKDLNGHNDLNDYELKVIGDISLIQ